MANRPTIMLPRRILTDRRGISSIEFAMVAAVFFLFVFGIIDFSRALWEWNMAARATQAGVRYAVVSNPVAEEIKTFSGLGLDPPVGNGATVPLDRFNGGNPVVCQKSGATGSCSTGWTYNEIAFQAIFQRIQGVYGEITDQDVIVEYAHVGLGFSGNPAATPLSPDLKTGDLPGMPVLQSKHELERVGLEEWQEQMANTYRPLVTEECA